MRHETTSRRWAMALATACCVALLAPASEAASLTPNRDRKHVCDWTFVSGPRQGEIGKESRRWLGPLPNLQSDIWWPGKTAAGTNQLTSPYQVPGDVPLTRWNLVSTLGGTKVTGKLDVSAVRYRGAESQRVIYHHVSNGAAVSCLELSPSAQTWLRDRYAAPGDVCACGTGYHYDATIACIERCTAYWSDPDLWELRRPFCLGSTSIVRKLSCLLTHDPADAGPPPPPPYEGGGELGDECGWGNGKFCRPECWCSASNRCVCPPPPV